MSDWSALAVDAKHVDELPQDSPQFQLAKLTEKMFADALLGLRDRSPSIPVRRLAAFVWDLLGAGLVQTAMGPVETPSFVVHEVDDRLFGLIMLPSLWSTAATADPFAQLGSVVYVSSLALDFAQGKYLAESDVPRARALAYEVEYTKTLAGWGPSGRSLTPHQSMLLREIPDGINTQELQEHLYEWKPLSELVR
jgi:hypothetical protein